MAESDPDPTLARMIERATQLLGSDAVERILAQPKAPLTGDQLDYVANLLRPEAASDDESDSHDVA